MPWPRKNGLPLCSKAGVYSITNLRNGKVYIGSAAAIRGRMHYHRSFLRRGKHDNQYLQRAWAKYGEAAFRFDVLEICELVTLIEREQYWIDSLNACNRSNGYNICPAAGSAMQGRKHSEESCAKMSKQRKGKIPHAATEAAAIANTGRKRTSESVAKTAAGLTGQKRTKKQVANIKAAHWTKGPNAAEISAKIIANRPQTLSAEHRARIAAGGKARWARIKLQREGVKT